MSLSLFLYLSLALSLSLVNIVSLTGKIYYFFRPTLKQITLIY